MADFVPAHVWKNQDALRGPEETRFRQHLPAKISKNVADPLIFVNGPLHTPTDVHVHLSPFHLHSLPSGPVYLFQVRMWFCYTGGNRPWVPTSQEMTGKEAIFCPLHLSCPQTGENESRCQGNVSKGVNLSQQMPGIHLFLKKQKLLQGITAISPAPSLFTDKRAPSVAKRNNATHTCGIYYVLYTYKLTLPQHKDAPFFILSFNLRCQNPSESPHNKPFNIGQRLH